MDRLSRCRSWLPPLAFGLAVAGSAAALWTAHAFELIAPCRVYVEGCTSISAVGRQPPASYVFRLTVIPALLATTVIWILVGRWLFDAAIASRRAATIIGAAGATAPLLAITYVLLLGVDAPRLEALKEWCIYLYFLVALVTKTLTGALLVGHARPGRSAPSPWLLHGMLWLAFTVLLTALSGVVVDQALEDPSRIRNLLQWHATSAYTAWYLLLWQAWR